MFNITSQTTGIVLPGAAALPSQYLTFMLGDEQFAVGILHIKEIIEYGSLAAVPMMPSCVRGVINLRGAVVPVIDLSARFGRGVNSIGKRTSIIIAEIEEEGIGRQVLGMMVDAVNAVVEIEADEIEAAPSFGTRIRPDFIAGIGKINSKFVILLAIERVLSTAEVVELSRQSAMSTATAAVGGQPVAALPA